MSRPLSSLQNGRNLLHCAAQRGHIQLMEFVMEDLEDVCVDETDKVGRFFMALFHEVWSCFAELSRNVALGLGKRIRVRQHYSQKSSCRVSLEMMGILALVQLLPADDLILCFLSLLDCVSVSFQRWTGQRFTWPQSTGSWRWWSSSFDWVVLTVPKTRYGHETTCKGGEVQGLGDVKTREQNSK